MKTIQAIYKAISKINPTAQASMSGYDINTLVWENGTQPINKQDILDLVPECLAEIEVEEQNKETRKQSAISKLKAIGLTDEEITSLIGE